jgi:hypothetical protein
VVTKLALLILTLAVAVRVHVTIHAMGCTATPSILQLLVIAAYVAVAGIFWLAARSCLNLPFWPRHLGGVTW